MINPIIPKKKVYRKKTYDKIEKMEEDTYIFCKECSHSILMSEWLENSSVCLHCGHHYPLTARDRINLICDAQSFVEFDPFMTADDPLNFEGYKEKLIFDKQKTGLAEAIICGSGEINGTTCVLAVMEKGFRMGSMGTVVGQKIFNSVKLACEKKCPFIIFTCSGGARMQEGVLSLMQMAKTLEAFELLNREGLLSVVVLTDPTTGGVSASFAMAADVIIAEPKAIVGFAGRKVIANTIKEELPEEFQTAEFLLKQGHIDDVVSRGQQKEYLTKLFRLFAPADTGKKGYLSLASRKNRKKMKASKPVVRAMDSLKKVRKMERPGTLEYVSHLFTDFVTFHGDRMTMEDAAIITGAGLYYGQPVTVIGHQRGHDYKESIARNFGMPTPAGFRKVQRILRQSEKFKRPVVTFVDTKGADPTAKSEMNNQSEAIAQCIRQMLITEVPVISIVIGEGGSGGALAISTGNELLMLENAVFSVISPEGAASILWKNSQLVQKAVENLKITAFDLAKLGIVDSIIPEADSDAALDVKRQAELIDHHLFTSLKKLSAFSGAELVAQRFSKYAAIGEQEISVRKECKENV